MKKVSRKPTVEHEPENPVKVFSTETLIQLLTDASRREAALKDIQEKISSLEGELQHLYLARQVLTPPEQKEEEASTEATKVAKPQKEPSASTRKMTPRGAHLTAITEALKGEKSGLTLAELKAKLDEMGHPMDIKNLSTTLFNIRQKNGGILEQVGERGSFKFKLATPRK